MNYPIEFPYLRAEILNALQAISDPACQTKWVGWGYLDLYIHILYDDTTVIPNPEMSVSSLLYESEVPALQALDAVLGPMIKGLGDAPDEVYLADPRWPAVIQAAADALAAMEANEPSDKKPE
ncbi:MAG: hypothetical protein Q4D96_13790 [Propionibacteriaceae bacterium]|nr:hypothetical protein [Propionibacteriaceae bacterium]